MHLASCSLAELKEMTLSVLAERFDYHPNYLSNKFKKEKQFTVQEAILNEKLNRALFILRDETERTTIKELSWRLGFSDPAYFSQLFKKRFGMLPKQIQAT
jgi:two-component system response regulator YesN